MSIRDTILAANDRVIEKLHIPEWGCDVYVRTMTGRERDALEGRQHTDIFRDARANMAIATVCDEAGKLEFTFADIEAVAAMNAKALDRIWDVAIRINHLRKEDIEATKEDFPNGHSSDFAIVLPSPSAKTSGKSRSGPSH